MRKIDSDTEVLEYAIFREELANHFFLALAERVSDPRIAKIFKELADEELEHKAKLELELMKMGEIVPKPDEKKQFDTDDYIISDTPVLDIDYEDMLILGIEKEEASFRTYIDLIGLAKEQIMRETLMALAQEEVKHKLRFEKELDDFMEKNRSDV